MDGDASGVTKVGNEFDVGVGAGTAVRSKFKIYHETQTKYTNLRFTVVCVSGVIVGVGCGSELKVGDGGGSVSIVPGGGVFNVTVGGG